MNRTPYPIAGGSTGSVIAGAIRSSFLKLDPRTQLRNPVMFAVYLGSILTTLLWLESLDGNVRRVVRLHPRCRPLALVHRALRQLRRGDRRGARQGPGRQPAEVPARRSRPIASSTGQAGATTDVAATELKVGDLVMVRAGRGHPGRRRRRRGGGLGG